MKNPLAFAGSIATDGPLIETDPLFAAPEQAAPEANPPPRRSGSSDRGESLIDWSNEEWEGEWPHPTQTASPYPIHP
jgi:hypothetical protein